MNPVLPPVSWSLPLLLGVALALGCGNSPGPGPAEAPPSPRLTSTGTVSPGPRASVPQSVSLPGQAPGGELAIVPPPPLVAGSSYALSASTPAQRLAWRTSEPAVVAVDSVGVVHAISPGTGTITATLRRPDGSTVSASTTVSVRPNPFAGNRHRRR
jgi:hypothetical protein